MTGIDIVAEMIRVAAGQPLAIRDVKPVGVAIETRIYAEDPDRGFIPSPGTIDVYRPPGGPGVRVDSGVQAGSRVTTHYDPLIAKLICWAPDRPTAIARTQVALSEFAIGGIATSIPFHLRALAHPAFVAGRYTTDFVAELPGAVSTTTTAARGPEALRAIAFRLAAMCWARQRGGAASDATQRCEVRELRPKRSEFEPVEMRCVDSSPVFRRYEFALGGQRSELDIASDENEAAFSVLDSAGQIEAVVGKKGKSFDIRTAAGAVAVEVRESSIAPSRAVVRTGAAGAAGAEGAEGAENG